MSPDEMVLLIIDLSQNRQISGKTLLQKRAYFASKELGLNLGFKAHFYGPYSPVIENSLIRMKSLGFVEEKTINFGASDQDGFEIRRYDYLLTESGENIINIIKKNNLSFYLKVENCLKQLYNAGDNGDYISLSYAAKIFHILDQKDTPLNNDEIKNEAQKLDWKIDDNAMNKAISFLEKLELVAN